MESGSAGMRKRKTALHVRRRVYTSGMLCLPAHHFFTLEELFIEIVCLLYDHFAQHQQADQVGNRHQPVCRI